MKKFWKRVSGVLIASMLLSNIMPPLLNVSYAADKQIVDITILDDVQTHAGHVGTITTVGHINVQYDDGSEEIHKLTECDKLYDNRVNNMNPYTIKAKYRYTGFEFEYDINGYGRCTQSGSGFENVKTVYHVGEEMDDYGLYVIRCNHGEDKIHVDPALVTGFDTSTPGKKQMMYYPCGFSEGCYIINYEVVDKSIVSIVPCDNVVKHTHGKGIIPITGEIEITYSDGAVKKDKLFKCKPLFSEPVPNYTHTFKAEWEYEGFQFEYDVECVYSEYTTYVKWLGAQTKYALGEEIGELGYVEWKCDDGDIWRLEVYPELVKGFDTSTPGKRQMNFRFGLNTEWGTVEYTVLSDTRRITKITPCDNVQKHTHGGGRIMQSGEINVEYSDGTSEIHTLGECIRKHNMYTDNRNYVHNCVWEFNGFEFSYGVQVIRNEYFGNTYWRGLKDVYYVGEEITDYGYLEVNCTNGKQENWFVDPLMVYELSTENEGTFTAKYCGIDLSIKDDPVATHQYRVISRKVDSIMVNGVTDKLLYKDDKVDVEPLNKGTFTIAYNDGTSEELPIADATLKTDVSIAKPGDVVTIEWEYKGDTFTKEVAIVEYSNKPVSIVVSDVKTEYVIGSEYIPNGYIEVEFEDGSKQHVEITEDMISGFDTTTSGKHTVVIEYEGVTTEFEITVIEEVIVKDVPHMVEDVTVFDGNDVIINFDVDGKLQLSDTINYLLIDNIVVREEREADLRENVVSLPNYVVYEVEELLPEEIINSGDVKYDEDESFLVDVTEDEDEVIGDEDEDSLIVATPSNATRVEDKEVRKFNAKARYEGKKYEVTDDSIVIFGEFIESLNLDSGTHEIRVIYLDEHAVDCNHSYVLEIPYKDDIVVPDVPGDTDVDDEEPDNKPAIPDVKPDKPEGGEQKPPTTDDSNKPVQRPNRPSSSSSSSNDSITWKKPGQHTDGSWDTSYRPNIPNDGGGIIKGDDDKLIYVLPDRRVPLSTWVADGKNWYYSGADGYLLTKWQFIDGKWYLLDNTTGALIYGWYYENMDGKWYFLSPTTGEMLVSWQYIDHKHYYMAAETEQQTYYGNNEDGWFYDSEAGARPYGSMYCNEVTPDGTYVSASGAK